jgi:hypothetical protein
MSGGAEANLVFSTEAIIVLRALVKNLTNRRSAHICLGPIKRLLTHLYDVIKVTLGGCVILSAGHAVNVGS